MRSGCPELIYGAGEYAAWLETVTNEEDRDQPGRYSLEGCADFAEHILVSPSDGDLGIFLAADDAVPDDNIVFRLCMLVRES